MKAMSFVIIKINPLLFSQFKNEFVDDVVRFFPNIKHPAFHKSIISLYQLVENGTTKGILFTSKPHFIEFGSIEISIIVYQKYQHLGVGSKAINEIINIENDYCFRVRKDNLKAQSFFQKSLAKKFVLDDFIIYK